jgi:hypothetical protein
VGLLQENRKDYMESDLVHNKAAGPGGIPTELLKYGGKNVITFLRDVFDQILAGEDIPQEWNSLRIKKEIK